MSKVQAYALPGGDRIVGGQLIKGHGDMARSAGAPKRLTTPAITPGMKRQTTGAMSAYHHGVTQFDEPLASNTKAGHTGRPVPIHTGMVATPVRDDLHRGTAPDHDHIGRDILDEAARLGHPLPSAMKR